MFLQLFAWGLHIKICSGIIKVDRVKDAWCRTRLSFYRSHGLPLCKGLHVITTNQGMAQWCNRPACLTCWQNFGEVQGHNLELCIAIHGCKICISAGFGKIVHFMAWLPHCTRLDFVHEENESGKTWFQLHHTAYTKFRTEYAAYILNEYCVRNLPLPISKTK